MRRITLFTKPGCLLCDEAAEVIEHVRGQMDFELECINILDDLATFERYKHDIPVICVNDREIARHHLAEAQLRAALHAAGV